MTYQSRPCNYCSAEFQPASSKSRYCSPVCRFLELAIPFAEEAGCWDWPLSKAKSGYGQFAVHPGAIETAHRLSYSWLKGEIPAGLFVLHKCDNRACFNPAHLFLGTALDNTLDMIGKGRQQDYSGMAKGASHPRKKGPERYFRRFTPAEVETILALRKEGKTLRTIGLEFNSSHSVIRSALRPDYYGSLQGPDD